jgi:hypothetical protein
MELPEVWVRERFQPLVVPLHKRTLSCGYNCILCPFCLHFESSERLMKNHVSDEHALMKVADLVVSPRRVGDRAHFHRVFPTSSGTKATDRSIKEVLNNYSAMGRSNVWVGGGLVYYVLRFQCRELQIDALYCTFCGMKLTRDSCERHVTNSHIFWSPRFCTTRKHMI